MKSSSQRKLVKHFHEPGDFHELTFSCYQQRPLLTRDAWRKYLSEAINAACAQQGFRLTAFVYMLNHVHLLVYPASAEVTSRHVSCLLAGIKRPVAARVKEDLAECDPELLSRLTIRERPGKTCFRFWQEGSGYDRNLRSEAAVRGAIDYLHLNPVRRGFVAKGDEWLWSSARWYLSEGQATDASWPELHRIPAEFWK